MSYGLTFNNKHSFNDMNLVMISKNRPFIPDAKVVVEDAPGIDGEYDFSEVNPDEEIKYKPFIQEIEFSFKEKDPRFLKVKARNVAEWLKCGEKILIFDDEPDKYYLAKVVNKIDFEHVISIVKTITIQFKCRPFANLRYNAHEITLDSLIMVDNDRIHPDDDYIYNLTSGRTVSINNFGTKLVKPIIKIVGSFNSISFTQNGNTLSYNETVSNDTIIIDCDKMEITKGLLNKMNAVSGTDFIRLNPGINNISIGGTGINCTVTFIFQALYI